jgi:serine/threonine-protein kinase
MDGETTGLEIIRTLGIGGMATVYLARTGTREVAVKRLHPFLTEDPSCVAILEEEARLGASICHPNVVRVLDFVGGESPELVMEYVDGVDLGQLARAASAAGTKIPIDVVATIIRETLSGLAAAHAQGVVHRDVSPQNILVGGDGLTRVTDFGIAKAAWIDRQTEAGAIKGKLGYLAPERLDGRCDVRSDLYAVGVVLWELLVGKRLRSGDGVDALAEILCARAVGPSRHAPEAASFDFLVLRALERSVTDRFATAAEMIEALDRCVVPATPARVAEVARTLLSGNIPSHPEPAVPTTRVERAMIRAVRRRWAAAPDLLPKVVRRAAHQPGVPPCVEPSVSRT